MADTETDTKTSTASATPEAEQVVIIGAGPAGLTAAWELTKRGRHRNRPRGRLGRGWHQSHRRAGRLAIRHRRPPLLHEGARGRGRVARDPPRRRLPASPAAEPHLLPRQVLRLSARADERGKEPRDPRVVPVRVLVHRGARQEAQGPDDVRGMGRVPVRAGGSTACSSRATPRRCGAFPPTSSPPTGRRSASRTCRSGRRRSTRCSRSGTRRRSPPSSRSSSTRSTGLG